MPLDRVRVQLIDRGLDGSLDVVGLVGGQVGVLGHGVELVGLVGEGGGDFFGLGDLRESNVYVED